MENLLFDGIKSIFQREFVQNFKFINEPIKMIEIEDNKQKVEIKANVEFKLTISYFFNNAIEKINQLMKYDIARIEKYKKAISDEKIQNASFDILIEYIEKRPLKVVYGRDVMKLLKKGLLKVVFLSWKFIKKLDDKLFDELTNINHKFNNANIIMFWIENKNYKELLEYEIIGVSF